uniref:Uncharacterized protein n=1 Tax=Romanomermis culicivorax TaxID=13658 RepID=A0A915JNQ9_ROMCU
MSYQRGTAQRPLATPSDEIRCLQSEMARLAAHVARLMAQQSAPPRRNSMPSPTPLTRLQNAGDRPSGALLQMCSYHERCAHNNAYCLAQHPNSASPSTATATGASGCYFSAAVVLALTPLSALLPPPPKQAMLVNVNPSTTLKMTAVLRILGPDVARGVLEFITDGTIRTTPVDKILLDCEPSSPAVDAIRCAVEEASRNVSPTAVVAMSRTTTMKGAQTLAAIAQQQLVANAFRESLRTVNDDVSIIEELPYPTATIPQSLKIGVLDEVHLCGGLVIDFPGEDLVSSDDHDEEE